jgi:3D (Asp-Asp-Asp) domain-containing protein
MAVNITSMRVILLTILLSSCSVVDQKNSNTPKTTWEKVRARITYYSPYQDKWGSKVADPNTSVAKKGITVAAHPKFKFGTEIHIPELKNTFGNKGFIVQDRGSAITSKKASKGKYYVFDVFVSSNAEIKKMCKKYPPYMDVYIKKEIK